MFKEFKQFILRGNVVDLAVGIVIGAAFGTVVTALVKDVLTPLISAIYHQPDFSSASFTVNGSKILYGDLLNEIIAFIMIAAAVFFLVVRPVNKLIEWSNRKEDTEEPSTKKCPYCFGVVDSKATRCMHCTSKVPATKK